MFTQTQQKLAEALHVDQSGQYTSTWNKHVIT